MVARYTTFLDALPLWGLFAGIVVLVLLSIEAGRWLGYRRAVRSEREKDAPIGAMVGSTLGLLAFMLAFTFGMASARYDVRKSLVLEEANAVGTTYLRAAMLPDRRGSGAPARAVDARLAVQTGKVVRTSSGQSFAAAAVDEATVVAQQHQARSSSAVVSR
jgi:hypothetical protein